MLLDHLAQAERHVAEGERHLAKHRAVIDELERDGHDTLDARNLLQTLQETQSLHLADRERIRSELESTGPTAG